MQIKVSYDKKKSKRLVCSWRNLVTKFQMQLQIKPFCEQSLESISAGENQHPKFHPWTVAPAGCGSADENAPRGVHQNEMDSG
ncbi:hypothetical protein TNCV_4635581 [Trichonephila clavipes]|nr:hypothetical protein TNCV_4635581 [Trichonephila clavipes]